MPHYKDQTFWLSVTERFSGIYLMVLNLNTYVSLSKIIKEIPVFGINCSSVEGINQAIVKGLADLPQTIALYPNGGGKIQCGNKTVGEYGG